MCAPDPRRSGQPAPHRIIDPAQDNDLQTVYAWLVEKPIAGLLRTAVDDAIRYVLDGARTYRFDLMAHDVDSDERSSVGTKLQYHVIEQLDLKKEPPLDTSVVGVSVEIKGTTRATSGGADSWPVMVPREGQCEITLMIAVDIRSSPYRFRASLMRAHRAWLTGKKGNRDLKRSPQADAARRYSLAVVPWTDLPAEPLSRLSAPQVLEVMDRKVGLRKRAVKLFTFLPDIVIPRGSLEVVGARHDDYMKRYREAKQDLIELGYVTLVGRRRDQIEVAESLGFNLEGGGWVAISPERFGDTEIPSSFYQD